VKKEIKEENHTNAEKESKKGTYAKNTMIHLCLFTKTRVYIQTIYFHKVVPLDHFNYRLQHPNIFDI